MQQKTIAYSQVLMLFSQEAVLVANYLHVTCSLYNYYYNYCRDSYDDLQRHAVEALLDSQTNIDSDGIVSDEEILPLSILDFTNSELQIVEDYLTPGAYKTASKLGL